MTSNPGIGVQVSICPLFSFLSKGLYNSYHTQCSNRELSKWAKEQCVDLHCQERFIGSNPILSVFIIPKETGVSSVIITRYGLM